MPEEAAELWKLDVEIFGVDAFALEDWLSLESYWIEVDGRVAREGSVKREVPLTADPITTFATSSGVMLLIIGAAALATLIAHAASR